MAEIFAVITPVVTASALAVAVYTKIIRPRSEKKRKEKLDYQARLTGIYEEINAIEGRVHEMDGEAAQLKFDAKSKGVRQVVDVAEEMEKEIKNDLTFVQGLRDALDTDFPRVYNGPKIEEVSDALDRMLKRVEEFSSQQKTLEAKEHVVIEDARRLLS
jgi:hypothetical protein